MEQESIRECAQGHERSSVRSKVNSPVIPSKMHYGQYYNRSKKGMKRTTAGNNKSEKEGVPLTKDEGIVKTILKEGKGDPIPPNMFVTVHYTGKLEDGKVFDSSYNRNQPFIFQVGKRNVILGWDIGVQSMKVGERAILKCAPDYAYGRRGAPPVIPPNATLYFEVEVLEYSARGDNNDEYFFWVAMIVFAILAGVCYVVFDKMYPKVIR
jgi:FKBP-type peptidyl-prolyl cis-trans isomerase